MLKQFFSLAFLVLLTSCASMSPEDCATADWRALGYKDGARGNTMETAGERGSVCSKHGYSMDHDLYREGRTEGLRSYCTENTAYSLGQSGEQYNGVCIDHGHDSFLAAYNQGYELFGFTNAVEQARQKLQTAEQDANIIDDKIRDYAKGERDENLSTKEQRKELLNLWAERKWLAKEAIPHWAVELRFAERELDDYLQKKSRNDPDLGTLLPSTMKQPEPYTGPTKADKYEMIDEIRRSYRKH
ncbi:MAG: DUF2799 domain-containing protein [Pseudomonadales bacterium]